MEREPGAYVEKDGEIIPDENDEAMVNRLNLKEKVEEPLKNLKKGGKDNVKD